MTMTVTTNKGKGAAASSTALSKRERIRLDRARQRRNRQLWQIGLVVLIGGVLAALLLYAIFRPQPGEEVISQGNAHITEAQMGQFAYNTSPPTSGPHLGSLANWGVHGEPIPNELQVHNLEDGGVIVQYNCPEGCSDLVAGLEGIVEGYREGVILAPYPDMDTRIALTAWQRIDQFEEFDEGRIERFIRAYLGVDHHQ
jgi:hypothetical protein